ncbi:MAG TPA: HAMP domain-containing sensor histidine kinase [Pseudomonadales bacterium]|nr:HAMP domain-containing sensor histidine kinase [Pseudomonadales bacterium]
MMIPNQAFAQGSLKNLFRFVSAMYGTAFLLAFLLHPYPEYPWFGVIQLAMSAYVFSGFIWQKFLPEKTMLLYVSLAVFISMFPLLFRYDSPAYIGLHTATLCLILAMSLPVTYGFIISVIALFIALAVPIIFGWIALNAAYIQWSIYLFLSSPIFLLAVYQFRTKAETLVYGAQKAERTTRQFLTNTSHELKTPLNGIMGINEILRHRSLPQDVQELLTLSHKAIQHLDFLIDELLDLTRLESNAFAPKNAPFEMSDVLFRLVKQFEHVAIVKGVSIDYDFDIPVDIHFSGDPKCLFKIYRALLDNAVKFSPQGHIKVVARVEYVSGDKAGVVFEVQDNGPGIPKASHATIFEPFVQLDGSLSRQHEGMGLGLTLAKRLTESMSGSIDLSSAEGKGATFTVHIPMVVLTPDVSPYDIDDQPTSTAAVHQRNILILTEGMDADLHFENVLSLNGAVIHRENTMFEAIKRVQQGQVEMLFMWVNDFHQGVYNTLQILREMAPDLPIMGIVDPEATEGLSTALSLGMNGYITTDMEDSLALGLVANCLKARTVIGSSKIRVNH